MIAAEGPVSVSWHGIFVLIYLPHPQPLNLEQGTTWPHYYKPAADNEKAGQFLFDSQPCLGL